MTVPSGSRPYRTDAAASNERHVDKMFEWILNQPATVDERAEILAFVDRVTSQLARQDDQEAELKAWSIACHALFASSRFQILE